MATLEELSRAVLELSPADRAVLSEIIKESLLSDEERAIREEWLAVAERRSREIQEGAVTAVSDEEALARARAAVANVRSAASRR